MMRKIETFGSIRSGILTINYRDKFNQAVKLLPDCRVKVTVEKLYKKRSTKTYKDDGTEGLGQNGYLWSIVYQDYVTGVWAEQRRQLTLKQAHEELLNNCSFVEIYNEETGSVLRSVKRTSEMNTIEFEEYAERCRQFIFEWFGITTLLPNEQAEMPL